MRGTGTDSVRTHQRRHNHGLRRDHTAILATANEPLACNAAKWRKPNHEQATLHSKGGGCVSSCVVDATTRADSTNVAVTKPPTARAPNRLRRTTTSCTHTHHALADPASSRAASSGGRAGRRSMSKRARHLRGGLLWTSSCAKSRPCLLWRVRTRKSRSPAKWLTTPEPARGVPRCRSILGGKQRLADCPLEDCHETEESKPALMSALPSPRARGPPTAARPSPRPRRAPCPSQRTTRRRVHRRRPARRPNLPNPEARA